MADKQAFSTTDGVTDKLYVATNLSLPVDPLFRPEMDIIPPVAPPSLESLFGYDSDASLMQKDWYRTFYDPAANKWSDNNQVVPSEFKGEVAAAVEAINIYDSALAVYDSEYSLQQQIQWRIYCAEKMIARV